MRMLTASTGATRSARARPTPKPKKFTESGKMRMRTSVIVKTMSRLMKKSHFTVSPVIQIRDSRAQREPPVRSSIEGYIEEIGAEQERHFPPSQIHAKTGTLS